MSDEDLVRDSLRRAAAGHTPDRTAMLNRIAANRSVTRGRSKVLRLAASGLALVTVLGLGGVARWAMAGEHGPAPAAPPLPSPASPSPIATSPSSAPTHRSSPAPSSPASSLPSSSASPLSSRPAVRGHPGDTQVQKGSLWSDGSVKNADASEVTLKPSIDLSALDLTIRVTVTAGLAPAGTVTVDGVTATVTATPDAIVYHFVLAKGATLKAGTYVFAGKYTQPVSSRNAGDDTYEAFATDAAHERPHVYGNFFPEK